AARFEKPADGFTACVDAAAIPEGALLRTRRDGDWLHPLGAPGRKSLSDHLIDRKCARAKRDMPLLCEGSEVLWVAGYTLSERLRVRPETTRIMRIRYEEDKEDGTDAGGY
ncbi:MAG: tRNA lysidine(34) synthetase TilS, partial [Clostridia bacterium]|nr:tRNA lysidine(34) synthetase TilS [Clostridia bacterium]